MPHDVGQALLDDAVDGDVHRFARDRSRSPSRLRSTRDVRDSGCARSRPSPPARPAGPDGPARSGRSWRMMPCTTSYRWPATCDDGARVGVDLRHRCPRCGWRWRRRWCGWRSRSGPSRRAARARSTRRSSSRRVWISWVKRRFCSQLGLGLLRALVLGDVAHAADLADHLVAGRIDQRRGGQRDLDHAPVLRDAARLQVLDQAAGADGSQVVGQLRLPGRAA